MRIELPDLSSRVAFTLGGRLAYTGERDYYRSSINVLQDAGFTFSHGCDAEVRSAIPITRSPRPLLITSSINS